VHSVFSREVSNGIYVEKGTGGGRRVTFFTKSAAAPGSAAYCVSQRGIACLTVFFRIPCGVISTYCNVE